MAAPTVSMVLVSLRLFSAGCGFVGGIMLSSRCWAIRPRQPPPPRTTDPHSLPSSVSNVQGTTVDVRAGSDLVPEFRSGVSSGRASVSSTGVLECDDAGDAAVAHPVPYDVDDVADSRIPAPIDSGTRPAHERIHRVRPLARAQRAHSLHATGADRPGGLLARRKSSPRQPIDRRRQLGVRESDTSCSTYLSIGLSLHQPHGGLVATTYRASHATRRPGGDNQRTHSVGSPQGRLPRAAAAHRGGQRYIRGHGPAHHALVTGTGGHRLDRDIRQCRPRRPEPAAVRGERSVPASHRGAPTLAAAAGRGLPVRRCAHRCGGRRHGVVPRRRRRHRRSPRTPQCVGSGGDGGNRRRSHRHRCLQLTDDAATAPRPVRSRAPLRRLGRAGAVCGSHRPARRR